MIGNLSEYSRIFVVDDSPTMLKIVRHMLSELKFQNLDDASDGQVAVEMLKTRRYSLVISDWHMTPVSGLELYQTVKRYRPTEKVPFLMMTAHVGKFASVARDSGIMTYIGKPFTRAALAEKIRTVAQ